MNDEDSRKMEAAVRDLIVALGLDPDTTGIEELVNRPWSDADQKIVGDWFSALPLESLGNLIIGVATDAAGEGAGEVLAGRDDMTPVMLTIAVAIGEEPGTVAARVAEQGLPGLDGVDMVFRVATIVATTRGMGRIEVDVVASWAQIVDLLFAGQLRPVMIAAGRAAMATGLAGYAGATVKPLVLADLVTALDVPLDDAVEVPAVFLALFGEDEEEGS